MKAENQLDRARRRRRHGGRPAERPHRDRAPRPGLRHNIRVGVQYLEAWLARRRLRAPLQPDGRRRHGRDLARAGLAMDPPPGALDDGQPVTAELFRRRREESRRARSIGAERFDAGRSTEARELFERLSRPEVVEFLTLPAYEALLACQATRVRRRHRRSNIPKEHQMTAQHPLADSPEQGAVNHRLARWDGIVRPYTTETSKRLRGSVQDRAHPGRRSGADRLWSCSTPRPTCPPSARSPATRPCSRCGPGSRPST